MKYYPEKKKRVLFFTLFFLFFIPVFIIIQTAVFQEVFNVELIISAIGSATLSVLLFMAIARVTKIFK